MTATPKLNLPARLGALFRGLQRLAPWPASGDHRPVRPGISLLLLPLLWAGCPPAEHRWPRGREVRVEIQGHRGCRGLRPENTMAGFRHAVALGVDVLELDLGLSRDGVLVVAHDPRVNPQLCAPARPLDSDLLRQLTFAQLSTLDCGSKKNPRFPAQVPVPGEGMPRLEQVLDLLRAHPRLGANIEIKTFPEHPDWTAPPAAFARTLVALLEARGVTGRVVVQSFDPAALLAVRAINPGITLAALTEERHEMAPMLERTGARILSPRHSTLRAEDIRAFQGRGVRVIPWTVNRPEEMKRLMGWGVDGIITDRPDLLLGLVTK